MKERLSVYLDPTVMKQLSNYADRRAKSKSLVAEAAIASFLSADGPDKLEAAFTRRLDRVSRQAERLERDVGISIEMLALFVRFWLTATPPAPDTSQAAAQAKGRERFENFVEALGRRMASGRSVVREVLEDIPGREPGAGSDDA